MYKSKQSWSHARWTVFLLWAGLGWNAQAQLTILQQPLSLLNALLGQSADFSITAQSPITTNLQYQWRRNGVNIPNATNSSLSVANVQGTNSGAFSAALSDGTVAINSAPAALTANILVQTATDILLNLLDITGGTTRSSSVGAVKLAGEPTILPGHPGGHPVWFQWTPLLGGVVTFSTSGSDFETMVGAYTGSSVTSVQPVPSSVNDDENGGFHNGKITFNAKALAEYQIVVDGYDGSAGDIVMTWSEQITSDKVATFTSVPPPKTAVSNNAPFSFAAQYDTGNVQWLFNGAPTGVTANTISIPQANDATVGTYVAQVTSAHGHTTATRAADLQISVLDDGSIGTNSFAWKKFSDAAQSAYVPPARERIRKLVGGDTRGFTVSQVFSTVGTRSEPGEPNVCAQIGGAPEWYAYVTPASGTLTIDTKGSGFNTILGVFTGPGDSFGTLTNIGCGYTTNYQADGQPLVYIANVPANQTNYILVDGENAASGTVHLNINLGTPVAVSSPPLSQSAVAGSNVTFSVGATGSTPISYAWLLNGISLPGATNSTLTLTNVQWPQEGTYTVLVSNLVGTANSAASLGLVIPPAVTNQPASQEIMPGTTASFTCQAGGSGPLTYQWLAGNSVLTGATNSCLLLANAQTPNAGSYCCVVANLAGAAVSAVAVLTVDTLPVLTVSPTSQTVHSNAVVTLNAAATGTPAPAFQWYWNGAAIGASGSSLTLPSFQPANEGTYQVVASNYLGAVTSAPSVLLPDSPVRMGTFVLTNGAFQIQLMGSVGSNYVIQVSSDLTTWTSVLTNTATNGFLNYTDPNGSLPNRFYRALAQ